MKTILKFWQEQEPNGIVADSSNRLVFLSGWLQVFLLIWFWEISGKSVDYALLGVIIGAITGTKLYSKHIEDKALVNESNAIQKPDEPGLP